MKKIVLIIVSIIVICIPTFAAREYYIKYDTDYDLKFLCFSEQECYNINPSTIKVKDKKFIGFGAFHYYDLSTYKYDKRTNTYSVDVLVDRDPSTDSDICNKCPYDEGNITHLIFTLSYNPSTKKIRATYKGFVSSKDIGKYENGKLMYISTNYLNIYYCDNPKYIKDLSGWLRFYNKKVTKTFGKPNGSTDYDIEIEYIIPYYIRFN